MTNTAASEPMNEFDLARLLVNRREYNEALAMIADYTARLPDASHKVCVQLERAKAYFGLERYQRAARIVNDLVANHEGTDLERVEALELNARLTLAQWNDLEHVVDVARQAAVLAARVGQDANMMLVRALGASALAFAYKRAADCAVKELNAAKQVAGESALLLEVEGYMCAQLDQRQKALACFQRCREFSDDNEAERRSILGTAYLARLAGDFKLALTELDKLEPLAGNDIAPMRERLSVHLGRRSFKSAFVSIDQLLLATPYSDRTRYRQLQRLRLLFELGRREQAIALGEELLAESVEDDIGRQIRHEQRFLMDKTRVDARRQMLKGFGSIAQLRDHCGPACCALILGYYGQTKDQTEIAQAIKGETGTPIYAMRSYLEATGLHVRRVETDLPLMKKILDLGIPLIMDEEYSSSRHVAVAVGYDDHRDILIVQDPMTHEIRETPYEELPRLLDMSNGGTIVAVPNNDQERLTALDAIGAQETQYIRLVDSAFCALDAHKLDEADELLEQSIALRRDYEQAWICKFSVERERQTKDPSRKKYLRRILDTMLELWPNAEWPQQYIGNMAYYTDCDYPRALQAYVLARDRDPGDGRNWAMIADCMIAMNRDDDAFDPLRRALSLMPWLVRANENLASLGLNNGHLGKAQALNEVALEANPDNPFNHEIAARIALRRGRFQDAIVRANKAVELAPQRPFGHTYAARAHTKLGEFDQAEARFEIVLRLTQGAPSFAIEYADLMYDSGRYATSIRLCQDVLAREPKNLRARAILGACFMGTGQQQEGLALLQGVVEEDAGYAWSHAQIGRWLSLSGQHRSAIMPLATALTFSDRSRFRILFAEALWRAGERQHAAQQIECIATWRNLEIDEIERAARLIATVRGFTAARNFLLTTARNSDGPGEEQLQLIGEAPSQRKQRNDKAIALGQRWICSCGAILRTINDTRLDHMAAESTPSGIAADILFDSWGIQQGHEVLSQVSSLLTTGHRVGFAAEHKVEEAAIAAWDFGRASNVLTWGYACGLIDTETAWSRMVEVARTIQLCFTSWETFAKSYAFGRKLWNGEHDPIITEKIDKLLLSDGAWSQLPWDTSLVDLPAPVLEPLAATLDSSQPLEPQLDAWNERAKTEGRGLRVVLPAGSYTLSYEVRCSLEIVGQGAGVIIENSNETWIFSIRQSGALLLHGIELRTVNRGSEDTIPDALILRRGLVELHNCQIRAEGSGVNVLGAHGIVRAYDCRMTGKKFGISLDDGHATLERTTISGCRLSGVGIGEAGCLVATNLTSTGNNESGVLSSGSVELRNCILNNNNLSGVGVLSGSIFMEDCDVRENNEAGIFTCPAATHVRIEHSVFMGNGLANAQIASVKHGAQIMGCRMTDSRKSHNLFIADGKNIVVDGCELGASALASVCVNGDEPLGFDRCTRMVNCTISNVRNAVYLAHAALVMDHVTIDGTEGPSVDVEGGHLFQRHCQHRHAAEQSLLVRKHGRAELLGCSFDAQIWAGEASAISIIGCDLKGGPAEVAIIATEGSVCKVKDTQIAEKKEFALVSYTQSTIFVQDCTFATQSEGVVSVENGSTALFSRTLCDASQISDMDFGAVGVDQGRGLFIDCEIKGSSKPAWNLDTKSTGYLLDCRSSDNRTASIAVLQGSRALVWRGDHGSAGQEACIVAKDDSQVEIDGAALTAKDTVLVISNSSVTVRDPGPTNLRAEVSNEGKLVGPEGPGILHMPLFASPVPWALTPAEGRFQLRMTLPSNPTLFEERGWTLQTLLNTLIGIRVGRPETFKVAGENLAVVVTAADEAQLSALAQCLSLVLLDTELLELIMLPDRPEFVMLDNLQAYRPAGQVEEKDGDKEDGDDAAEAP